MWKDGSTHCGGAKKAGRKAAEKQGNVPSFPAGKARDSEREAADMADLGLWRDICAFGCGKDALSGMGGAVGKPCCGDPGTEY